MYLINNISIFYHNNIGDSMKILEKNKILIISIFIFMIISFISIYSASMYLSPSLGKLYYKQIFWYVIGLITIFLFNKISMRNLYKYSFLIYLTNILLLIGLLLFMPSIGML